MSMFKCAKCDNTLDMKYSLICHVCNPDLAIAMKIIPKSIDHLKQNDQQKPLLD